jgi:hypothetical protein
MIVSARKPYIYWQISVAALFAVCTLSAQEVVVAVISDLFSPEFLLIYWLPNDERDSPEAL